MTAAAAPVTTGELTYDSLIAALGITPREGQRELVERGVGLVGGERLLAKAPTATGKSLAALMIAGIRTTLVPDARTVIATYTRLLQDQYKDKDLAAAETLFPEVSFAVLKGASNYLCRRNAGKGTGHEYVLLARDTGDPGEVRAQPTLFRAAATTKCKKDKHTAQECGFIAARDRAAQADVVITNHTLVLIDAMPPGGRDQQGLLGPHDLLIVDEIHNFPRAAESFGSKEFDLDELRADYAKEGEHDLAEIVNQFSRTLLQGDPFGDRPPSVAELQALTQVPGVSQVEELYGWLQDAVNYRRNPNTVTSIPMVARHFRRWADSRRVIKSTIIDIAPVAARGLSTKDEDRAVLMMSATTGTPTLPTYVADRCGVQDVELLEVPSALDYPNQMRASIITAPRDWSTGQAVLRLADDTDGRTLVLCRSWRKVHEVAEFLRHNGSHIVYAQDQDRPTNNGAMVARFKQDTRSCLIGTASFYEGIDVPGESLSQVIITDLPELMTMDPVAKQRKIRAGSTWNAFHQIPATALLMEQQMGRLIRSTSDRGLVAVIDPQAQLGWRLTATRQALAAFGVPEVTRPDAVHWFKENA